MGLHNKIASRWTLVQVAAKLLLCAAAAIDWCACTSILPDQVHCSSSVVMRDSTSKTLTTYHVDEYLDIKGERSSLSVEDVKRSETKIYYNQLHLQGYAERKFLMYNPMVQTCKPQSVIDWPLQELRQISIHIYSLDTLRRDYVDVPLGPSVILYAVLENAQEFKFITTIWSKSRLSNVDVYGRRTDHMPVNGAWRNMNLIVHVPSRTNRNYQLALGDPLSAYLAKAQRQAKLVMIGGCVAGDANSQTVNTRTSSATGDSIVFSNPEKLDEDTFCNHDNLRFVIRYNIVTEYRPGTLIGKSLTEFGNDDYSFQREPFVQPPGIGCWGSLGDDGGESGGVAPKWQRTIGKSSAAGGGSQLSGEYVTTRGSRGVSFVAYDRGRHLLRLDGHGRKSVYDLLERRSYHVGEFSADYELAYSARNELLERCVVLEMDQEIGAAAGAATPVTSRMLARPGTGAGTGGLLERLIGLSDENDGREHYLGTRIIDHVAYEVFEREWRDETGELPILLRANKYKPPAAGGNKKLYLTYYVRLDHQRGTSPEVEADRPVMIVKYIELSEFDARLKRRIVINRLRFIEFSWSLDVAPTNDYDGSTNEPYSPTLRLFNLEPCQRARSRQTELVVQFKQARDARLERGQVEILRSFELEIGERLVSLLANTIEVSRLNIVDLKLQILPTGDMISTNRFVDLYQGLSELSELGKFEKRATDSAARLGWRDHLLRIWHNRYSLEECLLDSLAWHEPNRLAYCPLSHECLIMRRDSAEGLEKWFVGSSGGGGDTETKAEQEVAAPTNNGAKDLILCTLYSHRYSTVDEANFFTSRKVADVAELNSWLLNRNTLELEFPIASGRLRYAATPEVRHVRQLDPIGARLANQRATLAGLRHTTRDEAGPEAVNVNQRVSLANLPADEQGGEAAAAFRHCQLACQMDDLCASFSVCERSGQAAAAADCVLSSLRLNAERAAKLIELGGAHSDDPKNQQFRLKITSACESQVFVMQRDDTCALYARDFLADYRVIKLKIDESKQAASGANLQDQNKPVPLESGQMVSLDECAGLCSELNLYEMDPKQVEFTYCPLAAQCYLKSVAASLGSQQLRGHGQCYVYAKRLSRAYDVKRMHHLSIKMKKSPVKPDGETASGAELPAQQQQQQQQVPAPANTQREVSPLKPPSHDEIENQLANVQLVTRIWGLSEEKCARECNLHKSTCLSFDSCRQSGKVLCLLYPIRSPLSKQSAYLPPLSVEQQVSDAADVSLASTLICDHYHLKPGYFEVRLKQLRDREQLKPSSDPGEPTAAGSACGKHEEIEGLISSLDRKQSKQELETLESEYATLERDRKRRLEELIEMAQASWLHVAFLAVGLAIGCLGALYKDYLVTHSNAQMRNLPWFKRQTRDAHDDLNELVRNDHMAG